jgi:acyl-CoA thioesterase II
MSRAGATPMENLISLLDLEVLEQDLYRGNSPQSEWQRVFGGQVIGQSLVAAQRTVDKSRIVHSLHAYFMRPGDPSTPIVYTVDRIRDGSSFATRRVVAIQHGKAIFSLEASFQVEEPGLEHQFEMPKVVPPEDLPSLSQMSEELLASAPEQIKRYWRRDRPLEIRPISLAHYLSDEKLPPFQSVWVRPTGPVPDDRIVKASVLAYLSDMLLLDTTLFAHGRSLFDPTMQVASLDHSMWFHRPFDFDDWLLYTMDSPNTNGARGLSRGSFFARDGRLIASVAQEGLIRERRKQPG